MVACMLPALSAGLRAGAFNTGKLNKGLENPDQVYPVFVRFTDQLLPGARPGSRHAQKQGPANLNGWRGLKDQRVIAQNGRRQRD